MLYAVAYSSFSENGLAVRDGIRQTERLVERFRDRLGRPRRVFIIGSSFGGLIAVAPVPFASGPELWDRSRRRSAEQRCCEHERVRTLSTCWLY